MEIALSAGALAGAIGAIALTVGAVGVIAQSRYFGAPIRWLWRTNISGPIARWNHQIVSDVVDVRVDYLMHHRNNGSSLLDLKESLDCVKVSVNEILAHDAARDAPGRRYGQTPTPNQEDTS